MNLSYVLTVLTLVSGILLLVIRFTHYRYPKARILDFLFLACGIALIAGAITNMYVIGQEEQKEKYSQYSGEISRKLEAPDIQYPSIKLGTAKLIWQGPEGEPAILIGDDPIRVWIEDGELKISTVIRDKDGKIIAKLEANEWQVNPNLIFDRNFDDRAVEVINEEGEVILQADFDGESVVFAGIFYLEDGSRVAIGENVIERRPPGEELQTSFDLIFKYPSRMHPGERR